MRATTATVAVALLLISVVVASAVAHEWGSAPPTREDIDRMIADRRREHEDRMAEYRRQMDERRRELDERLSRLRESFGSTGADAGRHASDAFEERSRQLRDEAMSRRAALSEHAVNPEHLRSLVREELRSAGVSSRAGVDEDEIVRRVTERLRSGSGAAARALEFGTVGDVPPPAPEAAAVPDPVDTLGA